MHIVMLIVGVVIASMIAASPKEVAEARQRMKVPARIMFAVAVVLGLLFFFGPQLFGCSSGQ